VGRRPLLLTGSAGMAVTLGLLALLFGTAPLDAHGQPVLHGAAGPLALLLANLYVVFFGTSWGPGYVDRTCSACQDSPARQFRGVQPNEVTTSAVAVNEQPPVISGLAMASSPAAASARNRSGEAHW